ncbi:hypothetical protein GCM10022287_18530 [Gryllotalpicola koreensis]|uniref:Uncharacterized protein n=1 Tax=Gryllotalpicola koreensis TaxID=993086 RepID=A0ABP7ZZX3_9MICO
MRTSRRAPREQYRRPDKERRRRHPSPSHALSLRSHRDAREGCVRVPALARKGPERTPRGFKRRMPYGR